ncbi:polysaccharide deacetylase family protein [Dermatophilaceae bacterium Soc4.6]
MSSNPSSSSVPRRTVVSGLLAGAAFTATACSSASTPPAPPPTTTAPPPSNPTGPDGASATAAVHASTPATSATPAVLTTPGADIRSGPATVPRAALTFHGAGDLTLAHAALDLLAARGARVTVFAVGSWLAATPSIGREIVAAGHALGNHTWSHPTLTHLGLAAATDEVRRGADAVAAAVGTAGALFRPSGTPSSTATIRAAALAAGYARSISYDLDSLDYTDPGAAAVVATVTAALHPGAIISLHLGHRHTIAALPRILDALAGAQLQPVTVPDLLHGVA